MELGGEVGVRCAAGNQAEVSNRQMSSVKVIEEVTRVLVIVG